MVKPLPTREYKQPSAFAIYNLQRKVDALSRKIDELEEWKKEHKRLHQFQDDCYW